MACFGGGDDGNNGGDVGGALDGYGGGVVGALNLNLDYFYR